MRYNIIRKMDISNGPGMRVSIFMQGCDFHCKNCFNSETWSFNGGKEYNDEIIEEVLKLCEQPFIKGLSILGGEPLHPTNIEGTTKLAKAFKEKFPDKSLWSWTGFLYENVCDKEIFDYLDVLVDGQFDENLRDPRLKWRGSSNQRVIDIKKTLNKGEIVLFCD